MSRREVAVRRAVGGQVQATQRTIVGPARHVENALRTARADGRLVRVQTSGRLDDRRVYVVAWLVEPVPDVRAPARRTVRAPLLLAGAALFLAGVLVTAGVLFVQWIAVHLAAVVGVGVLAFLGWAALSRLAGCPGLHCPGCRH